MKAENCVGFHEFFILWDRPVSKPRDDFAIKLLFFERYSELSPREEQIQ